MSYADLTKAYHIDITPDGQTLAVVVNKYIDSQTSYIQIILINLNDKKNYLLVESYDDGVQSLEFSPDGKQIASLYNDGNHTYIYIYNLETKEKKYIRREELSALFGGAYIAGIGRPQFIDNEIIYTSIGDLQGSYIYNFTWNIAEHRVKNYINFDPSMLDVNDSLILFCGGRCIGLANKYAVAVKDLEAPRENYITYIDNQLDFYSDKSFQGSTQVFDITGKMVANLGSQPFVMGKNIIQVNQPLAIGVYILTIKIGTEQNSYKFIVE